jgi:hypothetical protein
MILTTDFSTPKNNDSAERTPFLTAPVIVKLVSLSLSLGSQDWLAAADLFRQDFVYNPPRSVRLTKAMFR